MIPPIKKRYEESSKPRHLFVFFKAGDVSIDEIDSAEF
jgi:hypothetical protein